MRNRLELLVGPELTSILAPLIANGRVEDAMAVAAEYLEQPVLSNVTNLCVVHWLSDWERVEEHQQTRGGRR